MRLISSWSPDEVRDTTTTAYLKKPNAAKTQQDFVNPPSNQYTSYPTSSIVVLPTPAASTGAPKAVTGLSVTEAPYRATDGSVLSQITVSFSPDPTDANFDHVVIWFTGYLGSSNPQSMSQGSSSPFSFICQTTKETVTVTCQSVSPDGEVLALSLCPAQTLTLNGVLTGPPVPTIVQTLTTTPTGYQFQFAKLTGVTTDTITTYFVWRNTTNTPVGATLVRTYPQGENTVAGAITYQEVVPNGTVYYYFVNCCDSSGIASNYASAQSGAITNGSQLNTLGQLVNMDQIAADGTTYARILANQLQVNRLPGAPSAINISNPCFTPDAVSQTGNLTVGQQPCMDWKVFENDSSLFYLQAESGITQAPTQTDLLIRIPSGTSFAANTSYSCVVGSNTMPVKPGDIVCAGTLIWIANNHTWPGGTLTGVVVGNVAAYDTNDNYLGNLGQVASQNAPSTVASWSTAGFVPYASVFTVPVMTNIAKVRLSLTFTVTNVTASPFGIVGALIADVRFTNIYFGLAVNSSSPQVAKYGSMPPIGASAISYTTTTTSVNFSGTFTGYRTDNNLVALSGSYSNNCTGLSANTKYYFYPYWDDNVVSQVGISTTPQSVQFAPGGLGSTQTAFNPPSNTAMELCMRSDHIPIGNGPISVTTPSSGTGGGSGGGGGNSGTCPRADMLIEHRELGVISVYELLKAFCDGKEHYIKTLTGWTKVTSMEAQERTDWIKVDFGVDTFVGTFYHNWQTDEGIVPSAELWGHEINTVKGKASHRCSETNYNKAIAVKIVVEAPHLYLCGQTSPSLETHNPVIGC